MEVNGKASSSKRTRALNIRYFFIADQVEKGNAQIEYCPTDEMIGDFHTKPLQGIKFLKFGDTMLGRRTQRTGQTSKNDKKRKSCSTDDKENVKKSSNVIRKEVFTVLVHLKLYILANSA